MYSIADLQTGRWLYTGRNSETKEEALKELWEFIIDAEASSLIYINTAFPHAMGTIPQSEREEYASVFMQFEIKEHGDERIEEELMF